MTVVDRLASAGITPFRAWQHVVAGRVRIDGRPVGDPAAPADPPAVLTLHSGAGHVRPDAEPAPWTGQRGPQRVTQATATPPVWWS